MVTIAQRIELLRTEAGLSRPAMSAALGFPKVAFEKFETGRQTPTREQQVKMADYFGVALVFLRGESNDRTRQDSWMDGMVSQPEPEIQYAPPVQKKAKAEAPQIQGNMVEALLAGAKAQEQLRSVILDVLKSKEGQEILAQAIRKTMAGKK